MGVLIPRGATDILRLIVRPSNGPHSYVTPNLRAEELESTRLQNRPSEREGVLGAV